MNPIRLSAVFPKTRFRLARSCSSSASSTSATEIQTETRRIEPYVPPPEYTSEPIYPEILDMSRPKVRERKKAQIHEQIQRVPTVEEKQIKINMPRYYGFKTYILRDDAVPYNSLPLAQHVTRTCVVVESEQMHSFYGQSDQDSVEADVAELKALVADAAHMELKENVRYVADVDVKA